MNFKYPHTVENCKTASYAGDSTFYVAGERTNEFDRSLEEASNVLLDWFHASQLQGNAGKHNALLSSVKNLSINTSNFKKQLQNERSKEEELLLPFST